VPGWVGGIVVLGLAFELAWLSLRTALLLFVALLVKDFALYPLVKRAYEPRAGMHAPETLIGRQAVAVRALDPDGTVRLGGELWRARRNADAQPVQPGEEVRVCGVDGLTLLVEPPSS
jgi:membrane protein implicated in regulation of membrane protease activity